MGFKSYRIYLSLPYIRSHSAQVVITTFLLPLNCFYLNINGIIVLLVWKLTIFQIGCVPCWPAIITITLVEMIRISASGFVHLI